MWAEMNGCGGSNGNFKFSAGMRIPGTVGGSGNVNFSAGGTPRNVGGDSGTNQGAFAACLCLQVTMTNENNVDSQRQLTLSAARILITRYRRHRERAISVADSRYQLRMRALWESLIDHTSMRGHEDEILALLHEELEYIPVAEVAIERPPHITRAIERGVQVQTNGRRPLGDITNTINNRNNRQ